MLQFRIVIRLFLSSALFTLVGIFGLSGPHSYESQALTFKSGEKKSFGTKTTQQAPRQLLIDLVTSKRAARNLTDEELCLSLASLDLISTFREMENRGLDCLSIDKIQPAFVETSRQDSLRFLKIYARKNKVEVPAVTLAEVGDVFGHSQQTLAAYLEFNPEFRRIMGRGSQRTAFCLDWYPQVATIAENQSKNLDGTVSWGQDTLRDGFVICQDAFNQVTYMSLFDKQVRDQIKSAFENWIARDTPHRDAEYDGSGFFSYSYHINKMLIALELLHRDFGWNETQIQEMRAWVTRRALEVLPGTKQKYWSTLTRKCPLDIRKKSDKVEVCKNGGILQAQILLRAGIIAQDPELVGMSFLAFHRYMSGIRPDGSNAGDSARGCTAADYNIWASQFMSDYLYLWSLVGESLWDHRSFGRGSPREAVEYSLSLFGDWEKINEYTLAEEWDGCGKDGVNRTQQAGTLYEGKYYEITFAPYLQMFDRGKLADLLGAGRYERQDRSAFTKQSGIAYEASILHRDAGLRESLAQARLAREQALADAIAKKKAESEARKQEAFAKEVASNKARLAENAVKIRQREQEIEALASRGRNRLFALAAYETIDGSYSLRPSDLQFQQADEPRRKNASSKDEIIKANLDGKLVFDERAAPEELVVAAKTVTVFQRFRALSSFFEGEGYTAIGIRVLDLPAGFDIGSVMESARSECGKMQKPVEWLVIPLTTDSEEDVQQIECYRRHFHAKGEAPSAFFDSVLLASPPVAELLSNLTR